MWTLDSLMTALGRVGVELPAWTQDFLGLLLAGAIALLLVFFLAAGTALVLTALRWIHVAFRRLGDPIRPHKDLAEIIGVVRLALGADKRR
jgi:hypothetical protein